MRGNRRPFLRPVGERSYRKLCIIATEGAKTELQYFTLFKTANAVISIKCLKGKHASAPRQVLERMKKHLQAAQLRSSDEAWLVIDKDAWSDEDISELHRWSTTDERFGLAVSNPQFEYWLLLHFEEGNDIASGAKCLDRLRRYLPDYEKDINPRDIKPRIGKAIQRAEKHDVPPTPDWPRITGTTVYRLVKRIFSASGM